MKKAFWIVAFIISGLACLLVSNRQASAETYSNYYRESPKKKPVSKVPYFGYPIYRDMTIDVLHFDGGKLQYHDEETYKIFEAHMYDYWFIDQHFFKKKIKVVFASPIYCYYPNGVTVKYDGVKRWIFYKGSTTFSKTIM